MLAAQLRLASEASHAVVFGYLRQQGFADLRQSHFDLFRFPGPEGMTPTQLAGHVGLSKQALHPLLNELEGWGYVIRAIDPNDRRSRTLRLTQRGLDLVSAIREALERLEARTRAGLGARRYVSLLQALTAIRQFTHAEELIALEVDTIEADGPAPRP
ncbi:MAG: MarR family transcriptional regulator [Actinomycetota bacterium]|nr:MarR family transcriptional regulator [Actinomycetota bacterium]